LKRSANQFFTTETGSSRNAHDEANGFISGREPLAYHPKTGRWTGLSNPLLGSLCVSAPRDDLATELSNQHAKRQPRRIYFGRVAGGHRHHRNSGCPSTANTFSSQGQSSANSMCQQFASARSWLACDSGRQWWVSRGNCEHKRWLSNLGYSNRTGRTWHLPTRNELLSEGRMALPIRPMEQRSPHLCISTDLLRIQPIWNSLAGKRQQRFWASGPL
jgi:hypothetical protein